MTKPDYLASRLVVTIVPQIVVITVVGNPLGPPKR